MPGRSDGGSVTLALSPHKAADLGTSGSQSGQKHGKPRVAHQEIQPCYRPRCGLLQMS